MDENPFMSWFTAEKLIPTLREIIRNTGRPARSNAVAMRMPSVPLRTVQRRLAWAEQHGLIQRESPKTGYVPAPKAASGRTWWDGLKQLMLPFMATVEERNASPAPKRRRGQRAGYQPEYRQLELPFVWNT